MSDELAPGMRIGRYQLLFRLGRGGMGEVWAASQSVSEFDFQKLVALKILRTKETTSHAAVMFFDEARAASSLQHAAIVSTVDLGRDGDILFIAMDMVRGPSLTALLQHLVINEDTMSPSIVAYIGMQIASALDYAHERATFEGKKIKLIHRDVSPHNVLLDLNGAVRLTDFGVARTSIQEHESRVGTVRGKPSYMAPEQVVGGDIDARTDIFSLGIVLYESASLRRLFGRANPVKSMDAVLKHQPQTLVDLVPEFPPSLWRVIERALAKDPSARYPRAAELAEALGEVNRTLPGGASAARDLCALIAGNFPSNAFDTEGRVAEARRMAIGAAGPTHSAVDRDGAAGATAVLTRPSRPLPSAGAARTYAGGPATGLAWPTVSAPDPLAPDAIEEARTQFAARTPGGVPQIVPFTGAEATASPEQGISPFATITGAAFSPPSPPTRSGMLMVLALCVAAIVLLGAAFIVVESRDEEPLTALSEVPRTIPADAPGVVRATAKASSAGESGSDLPAVRAAEDAADPIEAKSAHPNVARAVTSARKSAAAAAPSPPSTGRRGNEPELDAPAKGPAERGPKNGGAPEPHATREQVLVLLQQVKKVDPRAYSEMFPTFVEAGTDNAKALNELRVKARAILAAAPR